MSTRSSPSFASNKSIEANGSPPNADLAPIATAMGGATVTKKGPDAERSRSNGWSRYFANNEVTNLASIQGNRNTLGTDAGTYRTSNMSKSDYGDTRTGSKTSVAPLELNFGPTFDGQRLSQVATGSPTMGRSKDDIQQGLSAEIRRAESTSSRGSDPGFNFSSNNTLSGTATWTPVTSNEWSDKRSDTRSISSSYSASNPFFLGGNLSSNYGSKRDDPPALPSLTLGSFGDVTRDSQASAVTVFPSAFGVDSPRNQTSRPAQPRHDGFGFPIPKAYFGHQPRDSADSEASHVTVFPRSFPSPTTSSFGKPRIVDTKSTVKAPAPAVPNPAKRGPSWLNLNAGKAG